MNNILTAHLDKLPNPFSECDDLREQISYLKDANTQLMDTNIKLYRVIDTQALTIELLKTSRSAQ